MSERSGRGLDEVFHYFISEEEQQEARARARDAATAPPAPSLCWCLPASPERPLACALATDLAAALASSGGAARILAAFPPHGWVSRASRVPWHVLAPQQRDRQVADALVHALEGMPEGARTLVVLPPDDVPDALQGLPPDLIQGLILAVDAAPWGLAQALRLIRQLRGVPASLKIGAVLVGSPGAEGALFRKLRGAVQRQLGISVEDLGQLSRDPACFRSLLSGTPVLELDAAAASARDLLELCGRLEQSAVAARV